MKQPILAIISDDVRRDLQAPLNYFSRVKIVHLYRLARYNDMTKDDFKHTIQYKDANDLYQKLKLIKPDIIQGPEPYASRAAFLNSQKILSFSKKYHTPFFFPMFENIQAEVKFGLILGKIMKWYLKKYTNLAIKVIPMNQGAKENLMAVGITPDKFADLLWATWGVDESEFYPDPKAKSPTPLMLFVGKIEKQKGVLTIIKAFNIAKKKINNLKLKFVGFGSLADEISKESGVEFAGLVKNKDIPKYYQEAWITVAPSIATKIWAEQVGMVNLQSIACGTPVITTKSGAIPQYVPDGKVGILIKEDDHEALAKAMIRLINDNKLRNQMSRDCVAYTKEHYSVKKNIKRAEDFVLDLLKSEKK